MESRIEQHPEKTGIKKIIKDKFREYSVLVIIALLVLVLVIYAYFRFKGDADKTMWGLYGDYVGGFLGTIVAFLSVYYLVATLREQRKHPIKDDYPGCWGVATFASNTKSHDDKGRGRPGDCLLRREQDQLQTAPV